MYRIDIYTLKIGEDHGKFSDLETIQIPLDDCLEATLEVVYAFQASKFGVTVKEVAPIALAITKEDKPVVMADIKVVAGKFQLDWRAPLEEKQIEGVRLWRSDLVRSAESESDPVEKEHFETQVGLIDVIITNGTNYCEPFKGSQADIKRVKKFAASGELGACVIVGEVGFFGPQRTAMLSDSEAERPKVQRMSVIGQFSNALVFGHKESYFPEPAVSGKEAAPEASENKSRAKKDVSSYAPFVATIFFAGIDPRTGFVHDHEDVKLVASTSLREVIESCQAANPTFMEGVSKGQAPILIQIESDGKLVALADVKREPRKEGYFVQWRGPLSEAGIKELESKAGQLSWGSMSSMQLEKSVNFDIQLKACNILLKGTEFSVDHHIFMEISKEVSDKLASEADSLSPSW